MIQSRAVIENRRPHLLIRTFKVIKNSWTTVIARTVCSSSRYKFSWFLRSFFALLVRSAELNAKNGSLNFEVFHRLTKMLSVVRSFLHPEISSFLLVILILQSNTWWPKKLIHFTEWTIIKKQEENFAFKVNTKLAGVIFKFEAINYCLLLMGALPNHCREHVRALTDTWSMSALREAVAKRTAFLWVKEKLESLPIFPLHTIAIL